MENRNPAMTQLFEVITDLSMKVLVLETALQELLRAIHGSPSGEQLTDTTIAGFRPRIEQAMQQMAGSPSAPMDAALTLAVAGILEAAGQPPQT